MRCRRCGHEYARPSALVDGRCKAEGACIGRVLKGAPKLVTLAPFARGVNLFWDAHRGKLKAKSEWQQLAYDDAMREAA